MNHNQSKTIFPLTLIAMSVVLVVVTFMISQRIDQYLKIKALNDCANLAQFTSESKKTDKDGNEVTTVSHEPVRALYRTCVEDKGYKTDISG